MARDAVIEIADSDSSTGSNGDNLIGTVVFPSARAQFGSEGSSARRAHPITHTSSNEPAHPSGKQKSPLVAPPPPPLPPPKRSKNTAATVVTSPPAAKPSQAETAVPIRRRTTSSWINSGNSNLSLELRATLAATLDGERRLNRPAGVTYSLPYGGGSKPVPLAAINSSTPGRENATPSSVGVTSALPRLFGGVLVSSTRPSSVGVTSAQPVRRNSERVTVDFLSQMETGNPAPVQIRRQNPPTVEMRAQWGETLTLGNRGRRVNLNLRLGFRG